MAKPTIKPQVIKFLLANPNPISTKELYNQMSKNNLHAGTSSQTLLNLFDSDLKSANPQFIRIYPKANSKQKVCLYALNPRLYPEAANYKLRQALDNSNSEGFYSLENISVGQRIDYQK